MWTKFSDFGENLKKIDLNVKEFNKRKIKIYLKV